VRARLAAALAVLLLTAGCDGAGGAEPVSRPSAAHAPVVAPYLDIVSGSADVSAVHAATGQADFTVAFVVAGGPRACTPTWGGTTAIDDATIGAQLHAIAAVGGEVVVATGGQDGTYLENACSAAGLAAAYEKILDVTGSNFLDLDIEQPVTPATITAALATVRKDRGTAITFTLPVDGEEVGLTGAGIALLRGARAAGLDVTVNAMIMNFPPAGDWAAALSAATESVKADVASVWTERSDREVYAMIGVTPMIGVNELGGPTTLAAVASLLAYAKAEGLGFVRFWSVNRDRGGCPAGTIDDNCSGLRQSEYAFTKLFAGYAG
jgi:chitinase